MRNTIIIVVVVDVVEIDAVVDDVVVVTQSTQSAQHKTRLTFSNKLQNEMSFIGKSNSKSTAAVSVQNGGKAGE